MVFSPVYIFMNIFHRDLSSHTHTHILSILWASLNGIYSTGSGLPCLHHSQGWLQPSLICSSFFFFFFLSFCVFVFFGFFLCSSNLHQLRTTPSNWTAALIWHDKMVTGLCYICTTYTLFFPTKGKNRKKWKSSCSPKCIQCTKGPADKGRWKTESARQLCAQQSSYFPFSLVQAGTFHSKIWHRLCSKIKILNNTQIYLLHVEDNKDNTNIIHKHW